MKNISFEEHFFYHISRQKIEPNDKKQRPTLRDIALIIAMSHNLELSDLHQRTRKVKIVLPRQVAMYFQFKYLELSQEDIGDYWDRNHATVSHAVSVIEDNMESYPLFKEGIKKIEMELQREFELMINPSFSGLITFS